MDNDKFQEMKSDIQRVGEDILEFIADENDVTQVGACIMAGFSVLEDIEDKETAERCFTAITAKYEEVAKNYKRITS